MARYRIVSRVYLQNIRKNDIFMSRGHIVHLFKNSVFWLYLYIFAPCRNNVAPQLPMTSMFKIDNERRTFFTYLQRVEWHLLSNQQRNLADSDKQRHFLRWLARLWHQLIDQLNLFGHVLNHLSLPKHRFELLQDGNQTGCNKDWKSDRETLR